MDVSQLERNPGEAQIVSLPDFFRSWGSDQSIRAVTGIAGFTRPKGHLTGLVHPSRPFHF